MLLGLIIPGVLAVLYESQQSNLLFSNGDIVFASDFSKIIPSDARVLTADQHNHPVPALTGRKVVMGYTGWLWSYGLNYLPAQIDDGQIFAGSSESAALLKKYDISYVVIGPNELASWHANLQYFQDNYPTVLNEGNYQVFRVK